MSDKQKRIQLSAKQLREKEGLIYKEIGDALSKWKRAPVDKDINEKDLPWQRISI